MNADELREALLSSPKNGFVGLSQEERAEMEAYCKQIGRASCRERV